MAIFSAIGTAVAGALFAGSTLAATVIGSGLAFVANIGVSYLRRPKKRKYSAVQGETQYGGDVPVSTLYGIGKVKGQRQFYAKWDSGNKYNAEVFILANGWCDGLELYVYLYGEKKTLVPQIVIGNEAARYFVEGFISEGVYGAIEIRFYDGRPGQQVDQRLVDVTTSLGATWKSTSVNAGLCYVVVERYYLDEFFGGKGKPEIEFVLRGLKEYDPRKDSTIAGGSGPQRLSNPSTWIHTQNPAVHRLNYQLGLRALVSGRTLIGEGKSLGQIDLGTYFVAMNVCDQLRADGKKTYQCSLWVNGDDDHTEMLKEFDDAMAGYGLNRRGLSGIIPGAPQIPVLEITPDDIPADRAKDIQYRKSAFDRYNHLSGQFTSIAAMWQPESLTPVYVNADIAADGRNRQTPNDFLQVSDPDLAQYLLNIRYRQNRKGGTATVPVSRRIGLKVQEGEWVTWRGITWMISEWVLDEQFRVTLKLTETGADIYDDEDIEPGPIIIPPTPPVNPSLLSTIQNFNVEAGVITSASGFDVPALKFTWDPPADPSITAVRFFYRPNDDQTELFNDQCADPEAGSYTTTKNVVSDEIYIARATITTVPDRLKTYTPWKVTNDPTGVLVSRADVLDNSITAAKIADAAVTAAKIQSEAVTNLKLANEAVSTAKLQVAAVTAQILADAAVTVQKLADGAVGVAKFAAGIQPVTIVTGGALPTVKSTDNITYNGALYTWNGSAYATPSFSLADGSVTASKLADAAVTAGKLANSAVTHDKIAANSIYGDVLAADSITARELILTDFSNIVDHGWSQGDPSGWYFDFLLGFYSDPPQFSDKGWVAQTRGGNVISSWFSVNEGEKYFIDVWGLNTSQNNSMVPYLQLANSNETFFGQVFTGLDGSAKNSWVRFQVNLTVPFGSGFSRARLILAQDDNAPGVLTYWAKPTIRRSASSELIVDGAITAIKIAAEAVTAEKIAVNSIIAGKIAAGAVGADQIAAGAVLAQKIGALAVTAEKIAAGAVTAEKVAALSITGEKIAANTISSDKLVADSITARELILTDFSNIVDHGWSQGDRSGWYFDFLLSFYIDPPQFSDKAWVAQTRGGNVISSWFSVNEGEKYFIDVWGSNNSQNNSMVPYLQIANSNETFFGQVFTGLDGSAKNSWVRFQVNLTIPFGSGFSRARLILAQDDTAQGILTYWAKPTVRRSASAELIVDGAITADKIAANAVTAGKIAADAIVAANIQAGTVSADRIVLNGVTTDRIAPNAVVDANGASLGTLTNGSGGFATVGTFVVNHLSGGQIFVFLSYLGSATISGQVADVRLRHQASGVEFAFGDTARGCIVGTYSVPAGTTSSTIEIRVAGSPGSSFTLQRTSAAWMTFKR